MIRISGNHFCDKVMLKQLIWSEFFSASVGTAFRQVMTARGALPAQAARVRAAAGVT